MFEHLPDSSRVWIYTSNKSMADHKTVIDEEIKQFISKWAAHGEQLFGDGALIQDYFIVLVVDESQVGASGCSIDTSVAFMRSLGNKLEVDLFDRMNVLIEADGKNELVRFSDLNKYPDCKIYDPMIGNLGDLRKHWLKPIASTPYS